MDNKPQSGGHLREGHEETDLSIKGIVWFGVFLVVSGILAFVSMYFFYHGLQWFQEKQVAKTMPMTPMEKQLQTQRSGAKAPEAAKEEEAATTPEWYGQGKDRRQMEEQLSRTFPRPRLQYDDEHDMKIFRDSEDQWLKSTGKDASGNIHIPVDRAIELLAQRGLPAVSGPWQPPTLPTAVPMVPMQSTARK
ncbi:MAG: hypothetical protein ACHP79_16065 [Terriglobales bacterium]